MTITELLSQCQQLGIRLWAQEGRLFFRAPESVLTPELRAELSQRKEELIELLRGNGNGQHAARPALRRQPRDKHFPLTFGQERLWFLWQWEPSSPAYNIAAPVSLEGSLNLSALQSSLARIVQRHETLRTVFATEAGQSVQVIKAAGEIDLACKDLTGLDASCREEETARQILEEARRPFDLTSGPLFRATLWRLQPEKHLLLCCMHHIISDGWSLGVLTQEIAELYRAFAHGRDARLPELSIQYADFAQWQRDLLQDEMLERHLSFWAERLDGGEGALNLLTDFPRPPRQTFTGAKCELTVDGSLTETLNRWSKQEGLTLFMTLLGAFQLLLSRYSAQEDFLIGIPVAGRQQPELQPLIGYFVNTLPLRSKLEGNPTFRELVQRIKPELLTIFEQQDLPFEKLVERLSKERDGSRPPLYQVVFTFSSSTGARAQLPELKVNLLELDNGTAKFDLTLNLTETKSGLRGWFEYSTALFQHSTVERMAAHYVHLLRQIARQPDGHILDLSLTLPEERRRILDEWGATSEGFESASCLHQLFEQQVDRTPDALAVTFEGRSLSYAELDELSNQLAHRLRSSGVGPELLVGISTARQLSLITGILGILKAGGAYVPLDPAYPFERLQYILQDTGLKVVLAEEELLARLREQEIDCQVIRLDGPEPEWSNEPVNRLSSFCVADNLAYVIYTSGSTGRPKGVGVTHRNVTRLMDATGRLFQFEKTDVWTLFHSGAFDFSVWEMWGALLYGGRLVVVPYLVSRSAEAFCNLLLQERVTVLNQTPSAFRQLSNVAVKTGQPALTSLRYVIFGGEALEFSSLRGWLERYDESQPKLVNMYGITETTVHVTAHVVTRDEVEQGRGSIIGKQLPDLQLYLLDSRLNPVPPGAVGEIYVGGAGAARGYLHNAELTAHRFIPNQFSNEAGSRLYRTGDLGCYRAGGQIEYLGRKDQQVKIRGFRIEVGEVEHVLLQSPAVSEAVVLPFAEPEQDKRLVAYIVPRAGQAVTVTELQRFLKTQLPDYMVPSSFVLLDALPLSPNNKVDRRALPPPFPARPVLEGDFAAPRTSVEITLSQVWAEVMGLDRVGVHDNFFELGGDSIRSLQVIARAQSCGIELRLQELFEHPTVGELALLVESSREPKALLSSTGSAQLFSQVSAADRQRLPPDIEDAYPLTMLQAGMLFHSVYADEETPYHNTTSLHLEGCFDLEVLRRALEITVSRHPVLRTAFNLTDYTEPLQLVFKSVPVQLTVEDIRHLANDEQEELLSAWRRNERLERFDWQQPPLIRFALHWRSENRFQFSWTEHHAILDGWSVAVMLTEIFQLYQGLLQTGQPPPLLESKATFGQFVALEREALSSDAAKDFWHKYLGDSVPGVVPEPPGRERPSLTAEGKLAVPISEEVTGELHQLAAALGVPLKTVLLAAHFRVLSLLFGREDVVTGLVTHGRPEREGAERVPGLFLNTLPVRLRLSGGAWQDLIKATFASETAALPYRRFPLAAIQRLVNDGQPLFETLFNFLHFHVYEVIEEGSGLNLLQSVASSQTNLKLAATFWRDGQQHLYLQLEYDAKKLSDERVEIIGGYYQRTLQAMTTAPEKLYHYHSLLSAQEQQQLLLESQSAAAADSSSATCLHQAFDRVARDAASTIAVQCGTQALTYAELESKANQLAQRLRELGVGPEVPVGVLLPSSLELAIGLLAILKAGGIYVPLDPANPEQRLEFILSDVGASVVITRPEWVARCQAAGASVVVDLCCDEWESTAWPETVPPVRVLPQNAAYIIYTSGSTGQPKGVCVEHRAATRHLTEVRRYYQLTSQDRVLQFASPGFDVSLEQILAPLLTGATVVMRGPDSWTPLELNQQILGQRLSVINLPPQYFHIWIAEASAEVIASLRLVIVGGDALSAETVRRWQILSGAASSLINAYGPTETVITSTAYTFAPGWNDDNHQQPVFIGRPLCERRAYILDANLMPAPTGTAGELYISGAALARGYYGRADLTAERFIPHSFSDEPGAVMYRTGDLVRRWPNGELEFLGRSDQQVKLRGYRIELGEIEVALLQHKDVREAVALMRQDEAGEKSIVGYAVLQDGATATPAELRDFLTDKLPAYMIPGAVVVTDRFPLTLSGKIDKRALPLPELTSVASKVAGHAPLTPTEEVLSSIWEQVLGLAAVDVEANFFELGGHSLLATQVMSWIRKVFRVELPLVLLFQHPTVRALSSVTDEAKQSMLGATVQEIHPVSRSAPLPLSFAQRRMWFLQHMYPHSSVYNLPVAFHLRGELDMTALRRAVQQLVIRHESFRTRFINHNEEPQQLILPASEVELSVNELSITAAESSPEQVREALSREVNRPFNLEEELPVRVYLYHLGANENVLLLLLHHIIADGWSARILLGELTRLYTSFALGEQPSLPELEVQYADYAVWQRRWLETGAAQQKSYWLEQLSDETRLLNLPTDYPRAVIRQLRGATVTAVVPVETTLALRQAGRQEGATLFMVLLAAWQVLLARYSGQHEIAIGAPIANRQHAAIENVIGLFVNTIVLRTVINNEPTFIELLNDVRDTCLAAYANQDVPFEQLVEELRLSREPAVHPLFQVFFTLQNMPTQKMELPGLEVRPLEAELTDTKFDLSLTALEKSDQLELALQYRTDLFRPETVARLLHHYTALLGSIACQPEERIGNLTYLSADEQREAIEQDFHRAYQLNYGLHSLFERQAAATPEAIAVKFGDETLSYRELSEKANRLTNFLIERGVGPETLVGVCLDRSFDMVISLLGILKAGGAYVPLDPQSPPARLKSIVESGRLSPVLTWNRLQPLFANTKTDIIYLDSEREALQRQPVDVRPQAGWLENPAYVMYTSGSTGQPKGVVITHAAIVNHMLWKQERFPLRASDKVLQKTPFTFDASVGEFWSPLFAGAELIIAAPDEHRDSSALIRTIRREGVTILQVVPSQLQMLAAEPELSECRNLRRLFCGGEPLPANLIEKLHDRLQIETVNLYGPTEATIDATYSVIEAGPTEEYVPIGIPIANAEAYVLDRYLSPLPTGVPGELYLGGASLARGYLHDPQLTAEKFCPHPFGSQPGERLYRTGDLVRRLTNGQLQFIGRTDSLIKLRGYRIDLGEIVAALRKHPRVKDAIAVTQPRPHGEAQLVAYALCQPFEPRENLRLKIFQHLAGCLPSYMLPAALVLLEKFPLNTHGKIDLRGLPPVQAEDLQSAPGGLAPRDLLELELIKIWEEVLQVSPIGIGDNFFELGGTSFLGLQLMARIRERLDVEAPLTLLMRGQTIELLAQALRNGRDFEPDTALVSLQPKGSKPPFFCVHPAGGSVMPYLNLARRLGQEQPFYGLQATARQSSCFTLEELAAEYVAEILRSSDEDSYLLGGWSLGGVIALEMARQLMAQEKRVALLTLIDSYLPQPSAAESNSAESLLRRYLEDVSRLLKINLQVADTDLTGLPLERLFDSLCNAGIEAGTLSPSIKAEDLLRRWEIFQANCRAAALYSAKPLPCRTLLFRRESASPEIQQADAAWQSILGQHLSLRHFAGDHYSMLNEPQVAQLAEILSHEIDAALQPDS